MPRSAAVKSLDKKEKKVKITWIGQAGLFLEWENFSVLVDPYLSDSVFAVNPANFRRIPIKEELFCLEPDVLITTHNHLDHFDPESLCHFFVSERKKLLTFLGPESCWRRVMEEYKGLSNPVLFDRHTTWTQNGISFTAVKAAHSDPCAIGLVIEDGKNTIYIAGDTLYNSEIFSDLPEKIDIAFLPVNGVGNNMNPTDAARFADRIGAQKIVPVHVGMFDEKKPQVFSHPNAFYMELYQPIEI